MEILAQQLGVEGVIDRSKRGPASLFYLPSAASFDDLDHHEAHVVAGEPYDAARMEKEAGALLAERQAEQDRIAAEAHAAAQARLEARIAAGFDPDDSLIEKLRQRFDLASVLTAHGYDRQGTKFRHPNSAVRELRRRHQVLRRHRACLLAQRHRSTASRQSAGMVRRRDRARRGGRGRRSSTSAATALARCANWPSASASPSPPNAARWPN